MQPQIERYHYAWTERLVRRGFTVFWVLLALLPWAGAQGRRMALSVGEAEVVEVRGTVEKVSLRQGVALSSGLLPGARVTAGDRLRSAADGFAVLELLDGSNIELQPSTDLEILDFRGGVRDLLRIWVGQIRLKIRKLVGAPNPYQMHSPIATIGVRGTEFDIVVKPDSVTTVKVYEGLVAVRNDQVKADEVLIRPGREVTVYPLRPPEPPITFEQVVAENFGRESIVEHPLLERFLAYPDAHLDLVDNPAYAAEIMRPSGRFYFYPARSDSFTSPEVSVLSPLSRFVALRELYATDERRLQGVSTRASYVYPFENWTLGGAYEYRGFDHDFNFRISRQVPTVFGGSVSVEQIGSSQYAPNLQSDSGSHRGLILAARRFPGQAFAFSFDWSHQSGDVDSLYELRPQGMLLTSESATTNFDTNHRRVTVGYKFDNDGLGSVGLFYRFGLVDGRTAQSRHLLDLSPAPLAAFNADGHSQEVGVRWRKRLAKNLYFAFKGSLTGTDVTEQIRRFRVADADQRTSYWIPAAATGLGYIWDDRLFLSLDYKYSNIRSVSDREDLLMRQVVSTEDGSRRNHAVHAWAQYQLPWGLFAGGGLISFWANETYRGYYLPDSTGQQANSQGEPKPRSLLETNSLQLNQLGFNFGRMFSDRLFLEYEMLQTRGPEFRPLSHGLLLRFSF